MFKKYFFAGLIIVTVLGLAVSFFGQDERSGELIIYSGRREQFVVPVVEKFESETGIRVRLLTGSAANFAHRIIEESRRPQADVFLANDAGVMEYLRLQGALRPNPFSKLQIIPERFRSKDGSWIGLSARARVFIYNRDLISEEQMPKSIFELTNSRYRGEFAITRPGNASMVSHVAAIFSFYGEEKTIELIKGILANEPVVTGGHTEIRKAVGAGEVKFGLVNNYYFHLQLEEPSDNNVAAIYPDQGKDQMGVFVNVAGAALIKNSPNSANAEKFIGFLLQPEQQILFSKLSKETPLLPDLDVLPYVKRIDQYRIAEMPLGRLGPAWGETVELMEKAGYVD